MTDINKLIKHCKTGDLKKVKAVISKGCDPTTDHNYAIQTASVNGHLEVVKYLVSQGCDPTTDYNYAIRTASARGHLDIVKYLVFRNS